MGFYDWYEHRVFPRVLDFAMKPLAEYRGGTLAETEGDVLEIGFGTGLNLDHYPPAVKVLHALDPMDALLLESEHSLEKQSYAPKEMRGALLNAGSWIFMMCFFGGAYAFAWFVRRQWR